jgi:hypothetical protein
MTDRDQINEQGKPPSSILEQPPPPFICSLHPHMAGMIVVEAAQ